ncbi:MAG: FG-GAP repeat domain-containing protein, partial [Pirellulaceae bacterium]
PSDGVTRLAVAHATATAIGDLDADGRADLAVAVHQGATSLEADSAIYFGQGRRTFERAANRLPTTGASFVTIAPAHANQPCRAIFCNSNGGTLREAVPLQVYWGGEEGFDPKRVWSIPFACGYESTAADLNGDGYTDLVALNSGHAGEAAKADPHLGANIFWGSREGFDLERARTVLREFNVGTSNVADLNRDGYLDLVLGQFAAAEPTGTAEVILWYGSEHGFERDRRTTIASPGRSISTVIADLNQDGDLDIAVNSFERDVVRVFWGKAGQFDADRQLQLPIHSPIDVETADLNADGRLDLIVGSYHDRLAGHHDTGTLICWGSGDAQRPFQTWNAQWLPGSTPIGHCVADFDRDGHLDIFSPHYHGDLTRESLPSYLFWGSPQGLDPRQKTTLICDSADDALAGDFDRDGKLDLAVVCHARDAQHDTFSHVYFNDGQRFTQPRITRLPTRGPHWMWQEDMGHIAHRRWEQVYESSPFCWTSPAGRGELAFTADVPPGTKLAFAVRSALEPGRLADAAWRPLEAGSGRKFSIPENHRVLAYRAQFYSDNGDRYPVLHRVEIKVD